MIDIANDMIHSYTLKLGTREDQQVFKSIHTFVWEISFIAIDYHSRPMA